MTIETGNAVALLEALVRLDSRNPTLVPGAPGEGELATFLEGVLSQWGLETRLQEVERGRPNVIATLRGTGSGRSLMFNGHIDTVDVAGMIHPPFDAERRAGRVYGRGASDMKGGVAAMCAAAARLRGSLAGDLVIACVVDEEWASLGTRALLDAGIRTDAAVVTEPTNLRLMPAHKGFLWLDIAVTGRAAHGSRWDIGIDAIRGAGLVLAELDRMDRELLPRQSHRLLGRPSIHASLISGGSGMSTYPDRCVVRVERRTLPGEENPDVMASIESACRRVREARPEFGIDVTLSLSQPPSDVSDDAPIVTALADSLADRGLPSESAGMSAWTDAALLNERGIPAICFGPGDMGLAHAAEEYIEEREIESATETLVSLAQRWCR